MVMKKLLAVAALAVFGAVAASPADAHRPRARASIGIHFGTPGFAYSYSYGYPRPYYHSYVGPYFPRPYYYYAPAPLVVVPPEPTVYIERPQTTAPAATNYWYYCAESNAYYPYVQQCAGPWQPVPPTPQQ